MPATESKPSQAPGEYRKAFQVEAATKARASARGNTLLVSQMDFTRRGDIIPRGPDL